SLRLSLSFELCEPCIDLPEAFFGAEEDLARVGFADAKLSGDFAHREAAGRLQQQHGAPARWQRGEHGPDGVALGDCRRDILAVRCGDVRPPPAIRAAGAGLWLDDTQG